MIVQAQEGPEYSAVVGLVKSKTAVTMTKIARHATIAVLITCITDKTQYEYNKEWYGSTNREKKKHLDGFELNPCGPEFKPCAQRLLFTLRVSLQASRGI